MNDYLVKNICLFNITNKISEILIRKFLLLPCILAYIYYIAYVIPKFIVTIPISLSSLFMCFATYGWCHLCLI